MYKLRITATVDNNGKELRSKMIEIAASDLFDLSKIIPPDVGLRSVIHEMTYQLYVDTQRANEDV